MSSLGPITNAIPSDIMLTPPEKEAVLEIAYLAVAADHQIDETELVTLRRIAQKVGGTDGVEQMDAAIDAFAANGPVERARADERLRAVASALSSPGARALAYRAAHILARADAVDSDEEFEFDLQLIDALGLSQGEADAIVADVERFL